MKGILEMKLDQSGAVEAFQLYVKDKFSYGERPIVKSVRMTRSGKFIVDIAQPEAVFLQD